MKKTIVKALLAVLMLSAVVISSVSVNAESAVKKPDNFKAFFDFEKLPVGTNPLSEENDIDGIPALNLSNLNAELIKKEITCEIIDNGELGKGFRFGGGTGTVEGKGYWAPTSISVLPFDDLSNITYKGISAFAFYADMTKWSDTNGMGDKAPEGTDTNGRSFNPFVSMAAINDETGERFSSTFATKANSPYQLVCEDGQTIDMTTGDLAAGSADGCLSGDIFLPTGFKGYCVIPTTSFYPTTYYDSTPPEATMDNGMVNSVTLQIGMWGQPKSDSCPDGHYMVLDDLGFICKSSDGATDAEDSKVEAKKEQESKAEESKATENKPAENKTENDSNKTPIIIVAVVAVVVVAFLLVYFLVIKKKQTK